MRTVEPRYVYLIVVLLMFVMLKSTSLRWTTIWNKEWKIFQNMIMSRPSMALSVNQSNGSNITLVSPPECSVLHNNREMYTLFWIHNIVFFTPKIFFIHLYQKSLHRFKGVVQSKNSRDMIWFTLPTHWNRTMLSQTPRRACVSNLWNGLRRRNLCVPLPIGEYCWSYILGMYCNQRYSFPKCRDGIKHITLCWVKNGRYVCLLSEG